MATKSQVIASVNGYLTEVVEIDNHRASMLDLINQLYPTAVTDTHLTQTYTTKDGSVFNYTISLVKHGNAVHISGIVTNTSGLSVTGQDVFDFKDTEYQPITGTSQSFKDATNTVDFILRANNFGFSSVFPPLSTYFFEYKFYIAKD